MWTWKSIPAECWLFHGCLWYSLVLRFAQNCAISISFELLEKQINLASTGINLLQPEAANLFWQPFINWVSSIPASVGNASSLKKSVFEKALKCKGWETECESLTSESYDFKHAATTVHVVECRHSICCLLQYLCSSAGRTKIIMVWEICSFWLDQ